MVTIGKIASLPSTRANPITKNPRNSNSTFRKSNPYKNSKRRQEDMEAGSKVLLPCCFYTQDNNLKNLDESLQ